MGVYVGREHCVFGEPRELLTRVWVQEGYLEYQQMPDSHPARCEFLWGPRAYAETSKCQVMEFMLRVNERDLRAFPLLVCRGCEGGGIGGLRQSSRQVDPSLSD